MARSKKLFLTSHKLGSWHLIQFKNSRLEKFFGVSSVSVLYEYRKTASRIKSAELRHEIKKEALKQLERDIKLKILELFTKAILYKKLTEVKREEMAIAYVRYDRARQKKDLGISTNLKVYQLESIYREKRKDLLNAQYEYNKALRLDMNALIDVEDLDFKPKVGILGKFSR